MAHDKLKAELEERLQQLQARLAGIKKDVTQAHSGDSAEQSQERENDEVVDVIGNETVQSIHDIQSALARIDQGSYGICDNCGENISRERLKVLPQALRCVDCAE